ncbi:MAG: ECF-type sigma factor [Planctomycetota bacterium]
MTTSDSPNSGMKADPSRELSDAIYQRLRTLARAQMASEARGITLQPTALVHEVYLRLQKDPSLNWANDREFFAAAGECMRRVLVDEARRRKALKRGGDRARVELPEVPDNTPGAQEEVVGVLSLDAALSRLCELDSRLYEVVVLRYFAGLSVTNTASLMGIAPRTVKRDWVAARTWLRAKIASQPVGDEV